MIGCKYRHALRAKHLGSHVSVTDDIPTPNFDTGQSGRCRCFRANMSRTSSKMEDPIASTEMNNPTMKRVPHGDFGNIALLVLLYVLQGVPMGISASVSFILQEKGATLSEQGIFSLASWPFSFKFLWAPLVDSYYVQSVGQRRSWILPLQVTVGLSLLFTAGHLDRLIYQQEADIRVLSTIFFLIYILLASQDIAVDGWALSMLSRQNVGIASTCNAVGQTAGFFIAFTGYLVLNSYFEVQLGHFVTFWGIVFLLSAACVLQKSESAQENSADRCVKDAYQQASAIVRLPSVIKLSCILMTRAIAFSAAETLTQLKLLERGVPKQHMATLSACISPINILLPLFLTSWTAGERPLDCVMATWMLRAVVASGASLIIVLAPTDMHLTDQVPWGFYIVLFFWMSSYTALSTVHFVSFMAFYSRISDIAMGGTYMTLLNAVSNLGYKWTETATLFIMGSLTRSKCCSGPGGITESQKCSVSDVKIMCNNAGLDWIDIDGPFHLVVLM